MHTKFFVLFVSFISLWQVAKSFVINDREPIFNLTESVHDVIEPISPGFVIDEDETPPVQSVEEEKVETTSFAHDHEENHEEHVSVSSVDAKNEVHTFVHNDTDVDNVQSTVKNEEKDGKSENHDENQTSTRDSDEEQENSQNDEPSKDDDENEEEHEEKTNKDEEHDKDR